MKVYLWRKVLRDKNQILKYMDFNKTNFKVIIQMHWPSEVRYDKNINTK
jgi:hypothetical protein